MELFGSHFGVILDTFWRRNCSMKSDTFQRTSPGVPGYPHRVKKLDFHWRVVQNRGSTFSRRGASGSGFGCQVGAKMDVQIHEKNVKNLPRKSIRNLFPKVTQNDAKMDPKWCQNGTKNRIGIVAYFRGARGGPPGSQSL